MGTEDHDYSRLSISEQSLLSENTEQAPEPTSRYQKVPWWRSKLLLSCIVQYLVIFALAAALLVVTKRGCSERTCTQRLSAYCECCFLDRLSRCRSRLTKQFWYVAPLLDVVEYEDINFDNDFAHQTKYRGPPTKELEEDWDKLWLCTYTPLLEQYKEYRDAIFISDRTWTDAPFNESRWCSGHPRRQVLYHEQICSCELEAYTKRVWGRLRSSDRRLPPTALLGKCFSIRNLKPKCSCSLWD